MSNPYSVGGTPSPEEWQAKRRLVEQGLMNGAGTVYGKPSQSSFDAPWSPPPSNLFGTADGPKTRSAAGGHSHQRLSDSPVARFLGTLIGGGFMLLFLYMLVARLVAEGLMYLGMSAAMATQVSMWWLPGLAGFAATVGAGWWIHRYRKRALGVQPTRAPSPVSRKQQIKVIPPSKRH